ncbi:uncharacterized protein LOC127751204 [Frankliniella occidentalis]|uniref:Uncharacterized protein LOC127751204 n=1 Tax=Frankliniella occidentalis TaxID=133901 RepID=A0A9C6X733_FRAOC|nr:uncharacterized protein LOC127751204 [Frankliniella occidentalis]
MLYMYEPWFLFLTEERDEFWLVPRRAVIDPAVQNYQTYLDWTDDPSFYLPPRGGEIYSVDLGVEHVHRLAAPVDMLPGTTVKECTLLFWDTDREEVVNFFQTCLTLALSSADPDTADPDFIQDWLKREDQDDIAKHYAIKHKMSEWMVVTITKLRNCCGMSLIYFPADKDIPERWLVPTEHTPVKRCFLPGYPQKETTRVRLKL